MFKLLFSAIGLLLGILGGTGIALIAAGIGLYAGHLIDRRHAHDHGNAPAAAPGAHAASVEESIAQLCTEVAALRALVDALSVRVNASATSPTTSAAPDNGSAATTKPADAAAAAPTPATVPAAASTAVRAEVPVPTPTPAPTPAPASVPTSAADADAEWPDTVPLDFSPAFAADANAPAANEPAGHGARAPAPGFNPIAAAWAWLAGGNTLVRVGVVVLFFGLAFLIKFAAERTVIPIELRYIGIGLGALAALALGWRLRERRPGYAMALQGFAVAVLYLSVFAAYRVHALLPGGPAFALLAATGVLSALLAVLQNARSLAVIGLCGGFLAPVLASSGGGSHVALFSYYALLNAAIFGIAWFKAWRALNVLGFLFTFGIGALWGARNYTDALFASTEPFLLLFFAFYVAIAVLYALRRAGERVDYVDGTLVFGVPIAAFGLQYPMVRDLPFGTALSALVLGAVYLPLAAWLARSARTGVRLLVEAFVALGLVFASLAIPLALDAKWTSASWAAEGAGIYWVALRQRRGWMRAFAVLLQFGAGISLLRALDMPGGTSLFGLQAMIDGPALSALLVGLAGLVTAHVLGRHAHDAAGIELDLRPVFLVWGLAFLNLVFPMLLDQRWCAVAWAWSGAATVLAGLRRREPALLIFGLLPALAGGTALAALPGLAPPVRAVLNPEWIAAVLLALAGAVSAYALHRAHRTAEGAAAADEHATRLPLAPLAAGALLWALGWWWQAGQHEIARSAGDHALTATLLFAAATALALLFASRRTDWRAPEAAAFLLLPVLGGCAGLALVELDAPAQYGGWFAWPLAFAALAAVLRRQEQGGFAHWLSAAHVATLWLATGLLTWQGWYGFSQLGDADTAWPVLGWALGPLVVLMLLDLSALRACWPLAGHARAYAAGAVPIALGLWLWVFGANLLSDGNAAPLAYLPFANPLDLACAGVLLLLLGWLRNAAHVSAFAAERKTFFAVVLGATAFFWLNGVLLRSLHHWAGIPFDFEAMMASTLVQAALSLFWALIALALMLYATRRGVRIYWLIGGALMAAVVGKLFLIDLARVGTVERIVSFIGVGLLLLVLGYFSPVPPRQKTQDQPA